ncbi:hypothetical protein PybrP1_012109 [[Pythium] brassicae (nom. inval.)]|nr:hypothetical protein PybrP1_012109 [[Pythium] brassicae (nom. inval.)]
MHVGGLEMRGALAVLALAIAHSAAPTDAQCSVPDKTLTFKCDASCKEYSPCWRKAPTDSTVCSYECYNMYFADPTKSAFTFLVPFREADAKTSDMSSSIFKDNDRLAAIDTLVLPSATTKVSIIGGSYLKTNYVRGRVVTVTLASDLVAKYRQVTDVYLANIDLTTAVEALTAMLPLSIKTLTLNNDLLKDVPLDVAEFTALQELYVRVYVTLTNNYITTVDASMAIDTVSTLYVERL